MGYVLRGCEGKYVGDKWENQDHVEKQLCNFSVVLKLTQGRRTCKLVKVQVRTFSATLAVQVQKAKHVICNNKAMISYIYIYK